MPLNQPRFIGSADPYVQWANKYLELCFAPIPLPPNMKNPPPTGWTGRPGKIADQSQVSRWMDGLDLNAKLFKHGIDKANIGIRLNPIGEYELVGIDVDHHPENKDDPKNGGPQLEYFEKKLGKLPETWCSSARVNGVAGIRLFLAPAGLMWRGDLGHGGEDIDVISKNYRFIVCFPSTNPDADGNQYWWYPPGFKPNGDIPKGFGLIPDPTKLPFLPDKWVDYCTNNRIRDIGVPMDMDSSTKQLTRWAVRNFADKGPMCEYMEVTLDKWKTKLHDSAKSHNVLTAAHYHIFKCGAEEGHTGWLTAAKEFEKYYVADVLARSKRTVRAAEKEVERSRFGALRRIKGSADEAKKRGESYFETDDACDVLNNQAGRQGEPPSDVGVGWPVTEANSPDKYALNDDGNAEHFLDLHQGIVHYVANVQQKWILWNGDRWIVDEKGDIAAHLYRRVKERQVKLARELMEAYKKVANTKGAPEIKRLALQWGMHAKASGNINDINKALVAARSVRQGISIKFEDLDKDLRALGCTNGVVRVTESGEIKLVANSKELLITRNTGRPYIPLREQKTEGKKLFKEFLDKFVAGSGHDLDYFQKLCGSVVLGDNKEKMAIFFHGITDTAKSTLLELMIRSLGDYADTRQPDIFKSKVLNPQLAHALSLRLVGVSELGDNTINSELFKNITGGERIAVELKGSNNLVRAVPQFTLIVTTNGIPNVPGEDTAFRNRLLVVKFTHQATDLDKLSGKQQKLYEHGLDAVLAWLIEGAAKYTREGLLPIPVEMLMATEDFASKLSDLADFAESNLIRGGDGFVRSEDVYMRFTQWADRNNFALKGWTQTKLTQRLKNLGFETDKRYVKNELGKSRETRGFKNCSLIGIELMDSKQENNEKSE